MKKVINNKRYNTETAKYIGKCADETMYQKNTGEFFLCNAEAKKIIPLDYQSAKTWAKSNLAAETYKRLFWKQKPSKATKGFCINLAPEVIEKIRMTAYSRNCTMSKLITDLIMAIEYEPIVGINDF